MSYKVELAGKKDPINQLEANQVLKTCLVIF